MKQKYLIDTKENKLFLKEMSENLLNFGHQFPAPDGTCYYLGDDGTPWKSYNRDTFETCRMPHVYTIGKYLGHEGSEELIDAAEKGCVVQRKIKKTVDGILLLPLMEAMWTINSVMCMHL